MDHGEWPLTETVDDPLPGEGFFSTTDFLVGWESAEGWLPDTVPLDGFGNAYNRMEEPECIVAVFDVASRCYALAVDPATGGLLEGPCMFLPYGRLPGLPESAGSQLQLYTFDG